MSGNPDPLFTMSYQISVATHAALIAAAKELRDEMELGEGMGELADPSFILRCLIKDWLAAGSPMPKVETMRAERRALERAGHSSGRRAG